MCLVQSVSDVSGPFLISFRNVEGETPVIDGSDFAPPEGDTALLLVHNHSYLSFAGIELRNFKTAQVECQPAGILVRGNCQHLHFLHCQVHDIWNTGGDASEGGNAFGIAVYGSSLTPISDLEIDGCEVHHLKTGQSESLTLNGNVSGFRVTNNVVHDNNNIGIDFIGFEGTCAKSSLDRARKGVCSDNTVWNISSEGNQLTRAETIRRTVSTATDRRR